MEYRIFDNAGNQTGVILPHRSALEVVTGFAAQAISGIATTLIVTYGGNWLVNKINQAQVKKTQTTTDGFEDPK